MAAIVYSPRFNISFLGFERLHPFDSRKSGRAWRELDRLLGSQLRLHHVSVDRAASDEELLLAHSPAYLAELRHPNVIGAALEIPTLGYVPGWYLQWTILRPMRWAVRGTVLAARAAIDQGIAINLAGGYHHAKRAAGEGFCIFSDIAVAIQQLRADGLILPGQRIAYVDLDAHQGNGVCHLFRDDRDVFIFDMYNSELYPCEDREARARIDCDLPLRSACRGDEYLGLLHDRLPGFLDSVARSGPIPLGIYNAGTDVIRGDPLGDMQLLADDVLQRDMFVVDQLRQRKIPVVMLTSGGYTRDSHQLIATSVSAILRDGKLECSRQKPAIP